MPPIVWFLLRRVLVVPITILVITATLYGIVMLAPPQRRAYLYLPPKVNAADVLPDDPLIQDLIKKYHLDDPFPVQYFGWLIKLAQGDWGWSIAARREVLPFLVVRTPVTVELLLWSTLVYVPLGAITGSLAAARRGRHVEQGIQLAAFIGTSIPVFVMAFVMMAIFYVGLKLLPIERLSDATKIIVQSEAFRTYTGLLTVDGLLNGRPDIALDALRHLAMPVITLSLAQWATLSRITRASVIEELDKDYVTVAHGKGLTERVVVWRHALRNALVPIITSSGVATASLITSVYLVELLFNLHGISDIFLVTTSQAAQFATFDPAPAMGFAVYTVLIVLTITFVLDVLHGLVDPRLRERLGTS
jgi:peptide/nickel transport system permease protein